jgi:DNA-binding MarR family transcriptional regulator
VPVKSVHGTITPITRLTKVIHRRTSEDLLGMRVRHIVVLTKAGREAFRRAEPARETVEDEVLAALDAKERETLRRLLAKALEG